MTSSATKRVIMLHSGYFKMHNSARASGGETHGLPKQYNRIFDYLDDG